MPGSAWRSTEHASSSHTLLPCRLMRAVRDWRHRPPGVWLPLEHKRHKAAQICLHGGACRPPHSSVLPVHATCAPVALAPKATWISCTLGAYLPSILSHQAGTWNLVDKSAPVSTNLLLGCCTLASVTTQKQAEYSRRPSAPPVACRQLGSATHQLDVSPSPAGSRPGLDSTSRAEREHPLSPVLQDCPTSWTDGDV